MKRTVDSEKLAELLYKAKEYDRLDSRNALLDYERSQTTSSWKRSFMRGFWIQVDSFVFSLTIFVPIFMLLIIYYSLGGQ